MTHPTWNSCWGWSQMEISDLRSPLRVEGFFSVPELLFRYRSGKCNLKSHRLCSDVPMSYLCWIPGCCCIWLLIPHTTSTLRGALCKLEKFRPITQRCSFLHLTQPARAQLNKLSRPDPTPARALHSDKASLSRQSQYNHPRPIQFRDLPSPKGVISQKKENLIGKN